MIGWIDNILTAAATDALCEEIHKIYIKWLTPILEKALAQARAGEREWCCAAICIWCKENHEVFQADDKSWWHKLTDAFMSKRCKASAIRNQEDK